VNEWRYTSTPICAFIAWTGITFLYHVQSVHLIVLVSTLAVSHRNPASVGTFHERCIQGHDKRDIPCNNSLISFNDKDPV
jgi:hypothetical protein